MDTTFGKKLTELRAARGYSQYQLGKLLGVTDKAVSKWENGKALPRQTACVKMAALLGVDTDLLLEDDSLTKEESGRLLKQRKDSLWNACETRMQEIYGPVPPPQVRNRFILEKNALYRSHDIILFDIMNRVKEAARNRNVRFTVPGGLGGFFTAWLLGASFINPLEAHEYCPKCRKAVFHPELRSGWDLPERKCECGAKMIRDGHDLPIDGYFLTAADDALDVFMCGAEAGFMKEAEEIILRYGEQVYFMEAYREPGGEETEVTDDSGMPVRGVRLPMTCLIFHPKRKAAARAPHRISGPVDVVNFGGSGDSPVIVLSPFFEEPAGLADQGDVRTGPERLLDKKILARALTEYYEFAESMILKYGLDKKLPDIEPYLRDLTFSRYISFICAADCLFMIPGIGELAEKLHVPWTSLPVSGNDVRRLINECCEYPGYLSGSAGEIILNACRGKYVDEVTDRDRTLFRHLNLPEWFEGFVSNVLVLAGRGGCLCVGIRLLEKNRRRMEEEKRRYG